MAGNCVYHKGEWVIVKEGQHDFVVVNIKKKYNVVNHTHIPNSYKRAVNLIDFAYTKTFPKSASIFILTSLIRISRDRKYILQLEERIRELKGR